VNLGKLVFAQITEHLPLTTFRRCVAHYGGHHKVKNLLLSQSVSLRSLNCLIARVCATSKRACAPNSTSSITWVSLRVHL